jgi:hypothetical protein
MKLTLLMTSQHPRRLEPKKNSYVQEITKPDKILADVVETKETSDDMTKHPNWLI